MTETTETSALVLGIDTGGTYTDAVLLEYHTRQVIASYKSLTTRHDLAIGIREVLENIPLEDPASIQLVSISTTLATNAIAEGKGKRVGLILIGYDPELVAAFQLERRFGTPHFFYIPGGHNLLGEEKEPLDLEALVTQVKEIQNEVDAIAVSSYFSPLNPEHERRAAEAISEITDHPIVLGHQLSTRLNSIERATTAALNASLLATIRDFILAVGRALAAREIDAPLMVVRGDGTLMQAEYAARSPVETIHSGPAASAIGARFLSRQQDAFVVDIGGTTTDLAVIQGGQVRVQEGGATVGEYKTSVLAADLYSMGLGGDSHIALSRENNIEIGPARVVPLAYLATEFPEVQTRLETLSRQMHHPARAEALVHWFLLREPPEGARLQPARARQLVDQLRAGPQPIPDLLESHGALSTSQLGVEALLQREIIGVAGLTPTDLLHVDGRFTPWDRETSRLALQIFSGSLRWESADLVGFIWSQMTEKITSAIVSFLSGQPILPGDRFGSWVFQNSLYRGHPDLETNFRMQLPLIGIGAPAEIFLARVAEVLHTELILPNHYPVANAVGAIAGSVMVSDEILVYPRLTGKGLDVISYYVQGQDGRVEVEGLEEALVHAENIGGERALRQALTAGADNPQVVTEHLSGGLDTYRVRTRAFGNPRLAN